MMKLSVILVVLLFFSLSQVSYSLPIDSYCSAPLSAKYPKLENESAYELKQALISIRHGDRMVCHDQPCWKGSEKKDWDCSLSFASVPSINDSPLSEIPTLFRKTYDFGEEFFPGSCYIGQLTAKGLKQHHENGKRFMEVYGSHHGLVRNITEVYARTTDVPRTVQSLQGVLEGMFPQSANSPAMFDIHTRDMTMETMVPNMKQCPRLTQLFKELEKTPQYKNFVKEVMMPLLQKLVSLGMYDDIRTIPKLQEIFDCIQVFHCHGAEVPFSFELQNEIVNATFAQYNYWFTYPDVPTVTKLGIGVFIRDLLNQMESMVSANKGKKVQIYSGHDTTVMPLAIAFHPITEWSPYATSVIFELYQHKLTGEHYVRLLYNWEPLRMYRCTDTLCPWETVKALMQSYAMDSLADPACASK